MTLTTHGCFGYSDHRGNAGSQGRVGPGHGASAAAGAVEKQQTAQPEHVCVTDPPCRAQPTPHTQRQDAAQTLPQTCWS